MTAQTPAQGRRVDADDRVRVPGIAAGAAVVRQRTLRHLKGDRVHVHAFQTVDAWRARKRNEVRRVERAQAEQIEHRSEIHEKWIVTLAREHFRAVRQCVDAGVAERLVVRCRAQPDVHRRRGQVDAEDVAAPAIDPRDRVGLAHVEIRIVERGDRTGVVQERRLVLNARLEPELVHDVVLGVAVVVHVDAIEHVVAELVEVRSAAGRFERNPVGDQRHRVRHVRTHEGIRVRVVRQRVRRDERRFTVTRRQAQVSRAADQTHPERPSDTAFHTAAPSPRVSRATVAVVHAGSLEPLRRGVGGGLAARSLHRVDEEGGGSDGGWCGPAAQR